MRMFADDVKIWNVIRTDAGNYSYKQIYKRISGLALSIVSRLGHST